MPGEQGVRRHDRGDVSQHASPKCSGFRGEPSALMVREAQTPGPELFPQDAVFLLQIVDDIALLLVHPTGDRDQDELQRMRQRGHGVQATRGWAYRRRGPREVKSNSLSRVTRLGHRDRIGGQYGVTTDNQEHAR